MYSFMQLNDVLGYILSTFLKGAWPMILVTWPWPWTKFGRGLCRECWSGNVSGFWSFLHERRWCCSAEDGNCCWRVVFSCMGNPRTSRGFIDGKQNIYKWGICASHVWLFVVDLRFCRWFILQPGDITPYYLATPNYGFISASSFGPWSGLTWNRNWLGADQHLLQDPPVNEHRPWTWLYSSLLETNLPSPF